MTINVGHLESILARYHSDFAFLILKVQNLIAVVYVLLVLFFFNHNVNKYSVFPVRRFEGFIRFVGMVNDICLVGVHMVNIGV